MKKAVKLLALCLTLAMLVCCLGACGSKPDSSTPDSSDTSGDKTTTVKTVKDGKLVMGTNAYFPPFEMIENGEVVGVDAEMMAEVAKRLNLELEISDMEFESLPEALSTGSIDLIAAGFTVKPDREETMDFTDGYYTACQTIIVKADSTVQSVDDIKDKGMKIGAQAGTTGSFEAEELTEAENILTYASGALAVEALLNGSIDLVIIDNNPAQQYAEEKSGELRLIEKQFEDESYAVAVKKGNSELLKAVNDAIDAMKKDGTFQKIVDKYIK
jgi:ABC-type amino acid transport substrate-binding protein